MFLAAAAVQAIAAPEVRVLLKEEMVLRVVPPRNERLQVLDAAGRSLGVFAQGFTLRAAADGIEGLGTPHTSLWVRPHQRGGSFWLLQRRYRGALKLQLHNGRLQAINQLPLESYLASVVGAEMPHRWPAEALRVQAVAARTYAMRQLRPQRPYDMKATVSSQVYLGLESETASTRAAVASTRGQVLTHGQRLIDAVFHSSSGGLTENSGEVWLQQLPYLKSVPDFDQQSPVFRWRQPLSQALLKRSFAAIGGVERIEPLQRTSTGRLRRGVVHGPEGRVELPAAELRRRLGLRSSFVRFEPPKPGAGPFARLQNWLGLRPQLIAVGRGFGHGVGLSQWGAYGLSRRGSSYGAILAHYYRGATLSAYRPLSGWPLPPPPL